MGDYCEVRGHLHDEVLLRPCVPCPERAACNEREMSAHLFTLLSPSVRACVPLPSQPTSSHFSLCVAFAFSPVHHSLSPSEKSDRDRAFRRQRFMLHLHVAGTSG